MTALASPQMPQNGSAQQDSDYLNTLPDPRTPSPSQMMRNPDSSAHPDLSNEVSMLSTKLINAINYQTNLDDNLQHTRHGLEAAQQRIAQLEAEAQQHADLVTGGVLVKKAEVDANIEAMRAELEEARRERELSDKGKKQMEVELENLTSALFEEANTMVAAARRENEASEKRNAQLKSQLNDTELLLASQQEQLQDLKGVMERMNDERDEIETNPHSSTAPSTPGLESANKMSRMLDALPLSPGMPAEIAPMHPLHFSHLITPLMRNDLQAYGDFSDLLKSARAVASHSRTPSSSASGAKTANGVSSYLPSASSSSPNLPGAFSTSAASSPRDQALALPPLKDNKFYKRCLTEDIEPTLRLDLAPGLSWLARRAVLSAISTGTLVVEPFVAPSRLYGSVHACALCGESRRADAYTRRHRFRMSDEENAQRYPLCEYCLGRVRTTGDFTGFLRMVRDGLWRARNDDEIKGAWEESVRLREKMFWARVGGGVVPVAVRPDSPSNGHRKGESGLSRMDSSSSSLPRESGDQDRSSTEQGNALQVPKLGNPVRSALRENGISDESTSLEQPVADEAAVSNVQDFASQLKADVYSPTDSHTGSAPPIPQRNESGEKGLAITHEPVELKSEGNGASSEGAPTEATVVEENNHRASGSIPGSFE